MAKSIVLRFGTKNLDKARQIADRIKKRMLEATAEGSKARAMAERVLSGNRRAIERARGERLADRGRAIRNEVRAGGRGGEDLIARFQPVASKALEGYSAVKAVTQGNLLVGASFAASFLGGPAGLVAQAATLAVEQIRPFLEREAERQRQQLLDEVAGLESRLAQERVGEQRLQEDPDFALQQARRLGAMLRAQPEQRWLGGLENGLGDL